MKNKILFTSIGRRVELIQAYKVAANKLCIDIEIHGCDITNTAPALYFCDKTFLSPRIKDDEYIPSLINYCEKERIDILIPTIDTDLLILSRNKNLFINTRVIISNEEKIKICRDKRLTYKYFKDLGLFCSSTVDDVNKYKGGYPAFIKPKDGSSSIYAYKVNNEDELINYAKEVPDYIIQEFIDGIEYTVDAFCDFEGNPLLITPRIRLAVRSGEVLKTKISQDKKIIEETKKILSDFKPCGPITIQLIREKNTDKDYYIEINPRYGGGAPLSIKAGADSAELMLRLINKENLSYIENAAEDGAIFSRFDQSIKVNE